MTAAIVSEKGSELTLQITIKLDPNSMLRSEGNIRESLKDAGCLAASKALAQFDTDGTPIVIGDTKLTSRGKIHNTYRVFGEK